MRFLATLVKFARESLRERGILLLALFFAPFFVLLFHVAYAGQLPAFRLAVFDEDRAGRAAGELAALVGALGEADSAFGIDVLPVGGREEGREALAAGKADLLLVIPVGFSRAVAEGRRPLLEFQGDPASAKYPILLGMVYAAAEGFVGAATGREGLLAIEEVSVRPEGKLEPFDASIPSLIILSIMTVLFPAAALFVRESEKGTIKRLRLSRLRPLEYLGAAAVSQLAISAVCVALTLGTAMALGYRPAGSVAEVLLTATLAGFSVIAFGLITAGFCASVKDVMVVGNFPYLFMLLFSGIMPLPFPTLFELAGHPIGPGEFLPMAWGVKALDGMLNFGRRASELGFELGALALLSALWFVLGLFLFRRRHLTP